MYNLIVLAGGATADTAPGGSLIFSVAWIGILGFIMYFMLIRPQKKQQKQLQAMLSTLEKGDSILTNSGFYGVAIDVMEEVVIVEFGNNKNCRIPMRKSAIAEIEKDKKDA